VITEWEERMVKLGKWFGKSNGEAGLNRSYPPKKKLRLEQKWLLTAGLFVGAIAIILIANWLDWRQVTKPLENLVFQLEDAYQRWLSPDKTQNPIFLLVLAFVGGLIASISPCKLALLSVNLSYIGTREITSRRDALLKASGFVLGVVTVLSLLGLGSSLIGSAIAFYRGYLEIAVGVVMLLMGLNLCGFVRLSLPQFNWQLPSSLGPYSVGLTFALVGSSCSSPVLIAVLSAAAATGSRWHSMLTMICYALGDTALIFLASLFAGLAKQARILLKYSHAIVGMAGGLLAIVGGYYLVSGVKWAIAFISYQ
jgi:cytochrome c-type biogenesis protein